LKLLVIALLMLTVLPACSSQGKVWTPQVKFKLEDSNYTETLIWISGFSYAINEIAKQSGSSNVYCLPSSRYIDSKELLEILNQRYQGKTISTEVASSTLLTGVRERFPCKTK
jgi:hypothetical protein